jgi:hypothetical protein
MDEYGFKPEQNRWVIGGLEHPASPFDLISHLHPADVEVSTAPGGKTLSAMLEAGEIDALFTANVPQCVLNGSSAVTRDRILFASDYPFVPLRHPDHRSCRGGDGTQVRRRAINRDLPGRGGPGLTGSTWRA